MVEHMLWVEKYRPSKVEDCILPENIKSTFQEFVNRKEIPNLLLSGGAGVGKTTVAKALCNEVGCDFMLMNGSETRGIDDIRIKVKNYATSMSLTGGRKVIIIDEADNLTVDAQDALRAMIEEVSMNCSFIFTCNFKNKIRAPIHSRCTVIDFKLNGSKQKVAAQFFKRVEWILNQEGVEYSKEVVATIITKFFPDNRRVLNELQRFSVSGKIDTGALGIVADVQISDLLNAIKGRDFGSARKWVVNNIDNDPATIFRKVYDGLYDLLKPNSVPMLVVILGRYQYQAAFVADHEINFMACVAELMSELEFK